jgi:predicted PurR-regulated permease PerM
MESLPKQRVSITTGTIIRFFAVAVAIFALYYMFDVLLVILAAVIFASAIEPIVRRLKRYRIHRIIGVIIVYLLMVALVAAFLIFFMPVVVGDMAQFLRNLPETISLDAVWSPIRDIGVDLGSTSIGTRTISVSDFAAGLQSLFAGTGAGAFQTASFIFGGVLNFILIMVLSFYLAVQEEGVENFLRIVSPIKKHDYVVGLWKRSQRKIGYWLQGQILLGIIVGVLVYLVLMIVGIPHALLLAILAAILEIIPVFGPIIAAVPAVLLAYSEIGVGTALLLVGLYLIIQQFENQLFYPLVVKKIVGISPIVVILALVIGAKFAGLLGALIAVPLSAALMEYIDDIEKDKKAAKELAA